LENRQVQNLKTVCEHGFHVRCTRLWSEQRLWQGDLGDEHGGGCAGYEW
jgi:hypothetical protein